MKRRHTVLIVVVATIVVLGIACGVLVHSCDRSMATHGYYHECEWYRITLDQAKYWYALDNGLTSGVPVVSRDLAPYLAGSGVPVCRSGGPYVLSPVGHYIVCSDPEHLLDSCKGGDPVTDTPVEYTQEYPLDYRNSQHWWYALDPHQRGTLVRMSGFQLLIEGLHGWGGSAGTVQIAGSGYSSSSSSSGDRAVTTSYSGGTYTMELAGHGLKITNRGRTLELDGQTFDLSGGRKTFIIQTNGVIRTGNLKE